jgi:alpha-amylase
MWPSDLFVIYSRLNYLNASFGFSKKSRPFIFQEVIDLGGEAVKKTEYNFCPVTEFKYSSELGRAFRGNNPLKWFEFFGELWGLLPSKDAVVFICNHDSERSGGDTLTYKMPKNYKMAQAFSLAYPFGIAKVGSF